MSGMKFHKRYHGDAWDGCLMLSLEERGAYNTLLDMIYMRDGRVPYDLGYLSQVMRTRPHKLERIIDTLVAKEKIYLADGYIRNARADHEINEAYTRSEQLANAARTARSKKVEKAKSERVIEIRKAQSKVKKARKPKANDAQLKLKSSSSRIEMELRSTSSQIENEFCGDQQLKQRNKPNEINDRAERSNDDFLQKHHCNQGTYKIENIDNNPTVIKDGGHFREGLISSGSNILYRGVEPSAKIPISDRLVQSLGKQRTGAGAMLVAGRRII